MQGSCYKFFSKETISWNTAKHECEKRHAKLVVINSHAENRAVGEKITRGRGTYIGLYRNPRDKSHWLWVDQSRSTYTHWYSGEPNNQGGREDCVHMRPWSTGYKWNDLPCSGSYFNSYVCESRGKSGSILLYIVQPNAKFVYFIFFFYKIYYKHHLLHMTIKCLQDVA